MPALLAPGSGRRRRLQLRDDRDPGGHYEAKVALNENWDGNYGQGGVQNGANIGFTVPFDGAKVEFKYDPTSMS
jgi:hypothetical protein